jgi:precorrin-3B synthase
MNAPTTVFPQRRGACPGLSAPMATGDGSLVRLTPTGTIPLDAFTALCTAAQTHGNGIIEVTARGNIQVRGLNAGSARSFATAVSALNIAADDGVPVLCDPLAGLDPDEIINAGALATDLRVALARTSLAQKLSAKVSIVVDGGGRLGLDAIAADIRLRAEATNGTAILRIEAGGQDIGSVGAEHGVEAARRLLGVLAERSSDVRARDVIAAECAAPFRIVISNLLQTSTRPRESGDPALDSRLRGNERRINGIRRLADAIGMHRLRDSSFACGVGLGFGHADAASLQRLIETANAAGASGIRTAPDRALLVIGLNDETLAPFASAAENLGFIRRPDDPRRYVVACAGAPICSSAHIAARAIGPVIAATSAPYLDGSFKIHVSGCTKGCAHPVAAALTIVGTANGCALVADGSARDTAFMIAAANELPATVAGIVRGRKREIRHV